MTRNLPLRVYHWLERCLEGICGAGFPIFQTIGACTRKAVFKASQMFRGDVHKPSFALFLLAFLFNFNPSLKCLDPTDSGLILNSAKYHLLQSNSSDQLFFDATPRWAHFIEKTRAAALRFSNAEEAIIFGQTQINFDHRGPDSLEGVLLYEKALLEEFPQYANFFDSFAESPYSFTDSLIIHKQRYVSNVLYYHMRYVLQCLTYVKNPQVICEIGGGYGNPARLWFENSIYNPATYIIIDFPESLFFSEIFLRVNLNEISVKYIQELSRESLLDREKLKNTIILCPVDKSDLLRDAPIDLVINTGSMHEMSPSAIEYWGRWLDSSKASYFYSLNFFAIPMKDIYYGNSYSPDLSSEWSCLLRKANPSFVLLQGGPFFADILAKRTDQTNPVSQKGLEEKFCEMLIGDAMNNQLLLDCIDILRFSKSPAMAWDLLEKVYKEMDPLPVEAIHLFQLVDLKTVQQLAPESFINYSCLKERIEEFLVQADQALY